MKGFNLKKNISYLIFIVFIVVNLLTVFYIKSNSGSNLEFRSDYALVTQIFSHIIILLFLIYGIIVNYKKIFKIFLLIVLYGVSYYLADRLFNIMTPW